MNYINKEELIRRMQVGAPINWTDEPYEVGEVSQYNHDMAVIKSCAEAKVIPIPPKATNGDMIKAMFPSVEIKGTSGFGKITSIAVGIGLGTSYFSLDWWNAPYSPQQNLSCTDKSGANIASQDVLKSAT